MRRSPAVIVALVATIAVGACGGSDEDDAAREAAAEKRAATQTLEDYAAAIEAGRSDEVCNELFTPGLVEEFEAVGGCEQALGEAPRPGDFDLAVDDVTVEGTTATARVTVRGSAQGRRAPEGGAQGTVTLVKQGDAWRISEIG